MVPGRRRPGRRRPGRRLIRRATTRPFGKELGLVDDILSHTRSKAVSIAIAVLVGPAALFCWPRFNRD